MNSKSALVGLLIFFACSSPFFVMTAVYGAQTAWEFVTSNPSLFLYPAVVFPFVAILLKSPLQDSQRFVKNMLTDGKRDLAYLAMGLLTFTPVLTVTALYIEAQKGKETASIWEVDEVNVSDIRLVGVGPNDEVINALGIESQPTAAANTTILAVFRYLRKAGLRANANTFLPGVTDEKQDEVRGILYRQQQKFLASMSYESLAKNGYILGRVRPFYLMAFTVSFMIAMLGLTLTIFYSIVVLGHAENLRQTIRKSYRRSLFYLTVTAVALSLWLPMRAATLNISYALYGSVSATKEYLLALVFTLGLVPMSVSWLSEKQRNLVLAAAPVMAGLLGVVSIKYLPGSLLASLEDPDFYLGAAIVFLLIVLALVFYIRLSKFLRDG